MTHNRYLVQRMHTDEINGMLEGEVSADEMGGGRRSHTDGDAEAETWHNMSDYDDTDDDNLILQIDKKSLKKDIKGILEEERSDLEHILDVFQEKHSLCEFECLEQITKLKAELDDMKNKETSILNKSQDFENSCKLIIQKFATENEVLRKILQEHADYAHDAREKMDEIEAELEKMDEIEAELIQLRSDSEKKAKKLNQQKEIIDSLRQEIELKNDTIHTLRQEIKLKDDNIHTLSQEIEVKDDTIQTVRQELLMLYTKNKDETSSKEKKNGNDKPSQANGQGKKSTKGNQKGGRWK